MLEEQRLEAFGKQLLAEFEEKAAEIGGDTDLARDAAMSEVILDYLEEAGYMGEHVSSPHEDSAGRNRCKLLGYSLPEDSTRLDIFTGRYVDPQNGLGLPVEEIRRLTGRAAKFFEYVAEKDFERFRYSPSALEAAKELHRELTRIEEVKIHVFTNGLVKIKDVESIAIRGRSIDFSIIDLERLYRVSRSAITRDMIEVDFCVLMGKPLSCLEMKPRPSEYETYLALFPGDLLFKLYDEFGPRLFEFNVRSFLQAKGKVNKGLRDTLKAQPERFLAFNNGIAATADEIEVGMFHGETTIRSIKGLQIVNGAQTTVSIHKAGLSDRQSLSKVAVAVKLTKVTEDKLAEFVPLISEYANTQNVIQISDLSANNPFHAALERLAESVWCPGEEQRWFYERARGGYQVAAARFGKTTAKKKNFAFECPVSKHFSKTDLAKYLNTWWQRPQTVSRGAQKNFSIFMNNLKESFPEGWVPDEIFFKHVVAMVILYKSAQAQVKYLKLPSYGANVVTYMVAKFSHDFSEYVDFDIIWDNQDVSNELANLWTSWGPSIHQVLVASAGQYNVTEWCKKDDCWDVIKELELQRPPDSLPELRLATPEVIQEEREGREDPVELCCSIPAKDWTRMVAWAASSLDVSDIDQRVANTLAGYALNGWRNKPSEKQAVRGYRVIVAAREAGLIESD